MNITIEFRTFELVFVPNFSVNSFDFLDQIGQKGYFWSKTKQVNITIQFCTFELVYIPGHNIHELCHDLVQVQVATCKTKVDRYYNKLRILSCQTT